MLHWLHCILMFAYVVLPGAGLSRAIYLRVKRHRRRPLVQMRLTILGGITLSTVVCSVYAIALHGRLMVSQVFITAYFGTALLMILKGFDRATWLLLSAIFRRDVAKAGWGFELRVLAGLVFRATLLFGIGLPFVISAVLTYRPKVASTGNPAILFGWNYQPVSFRATDGTRLAGWWIPSGRGETRRTVVLCHGQSSDMASQLFLVKKLVPAGYNVLAFDFRAHGESAGQLTSFGDLERQDVLGAVRWLRENHRSACEKLVGLGVSTGAAALIGAAAEESVEAQNIDAIAVYGSFDRVDLVANSGLVQAMPKVVLAILQRVGMPMAELQVGSRWSRYSAGEAGKAIWPRPLLVIHGLFDEVVPFERGEAVYDSALQPKTNFWIERAGHEESIENDGAAKVVKRFFDSAARIL